MRIKNLSSNRIIAKDSGTAESALARYLGLMFTRPKQSALVLKFGSERKISLHMAFVFYTIDVIFANVRKEVVDVKQNFRPFHAYSSAARATYAIELPAGSIEKSRTRTGDKIAFLKVK